MKFNKLDIIPSKKSNILPQETVKKLNNSRLSTESRTPPQETVEQEVAKLNITEEIQLKHSGDATEKITECIHKICHDIFSSETALLDAEPLDIKLFFLGKSQDKTKINLLKSLELVVYKTLYGHSWATIERANSVKFEECKSYPYTTDDIGIKITTLQQYHRDWKKLGYLEKLHDAVRSHQEFSELKELRKQHLEDFDKRLGLLNDISTLPNDEKVKLWLLKNDNQDFRNLDLEHNTNNAAKKDVDTIEDLSNLVSSESNDVYDIGSLDEESSVTSLEMNKQWDDNLKNNCELIDIQCDFIHRGSSFLDNYSKIEYLTKNNAYLKECGMLRGDSDFEVARSINFMHYYLKLLDNLHNQGYDTLAYCYWTTEKRKDLKFDNIITSEEINMKNANEVKTEYKWLDVLARLINAKLESESTEDTPCVAITVIDNKLIIGLNTASKVEKVKRVIENITKTFMSENPRSLLEDHFNSESSKNISKIAKLKEYIENDNVKDGTLSLGTGKAKEQSLEYLLKMQEDKFSEEIKNYKKANLKIKVDDYLGKAKGAFDSFKDDSSKSGSNTSGISLNKLGGKKLDNALKNNNKINNDINKLIEKIEILKSLTVIYTIDGQNADEKSYKPNNSEQRMHAEISVIEYIKSNLGSIKTLLKSEGVIPYIYIGNNKKACPACHVSMEYFNEGQSNPFTVVYRGHHHDFDGLIQLGSSNYDKKIKEIPNQETFKQRLDVLNQYRYASFIESGKENKTFIEKMYKIFTEKHDKTNIKAEHNPTPNQSDAGGELRDEIGSNAFNRKYDNNYSYNKEDIAAISNKLFTQEKLVELQKENIQWKGIISKDELEVIKDGETIVGVSKVNEHYIVLAIHRSKETYTVLCRDAVNNEWENYKNSDNFEITVNDKKIHISKDNLTFSLVNNYNEFQNSAIYALNDAVRMVEYVSDNQGNFNQESFNNIKFTEKLTIEQTKLETEIEVQHTLIGSITERLFLKFHETFPKTFKSESAHQLFQQFMSMVNFDNNVKKENQITSLRQIFADHYFDYHVEQIQKKNIIDVEQLKIDLKTKKQELEDQSQSEEPIEIKLTESVLAGVEKIIRYCQSEKGKSTIKANIKALQSAFQLVRDGEDEITSKNENMSDLVVKTLKVLEKVKDTTLYLKTPEEITEQVKTELGNPKDQLPLLEDKGEVLKNKIDNSVSLNALISQLDEQEFKLFWNVYHNAETFKLYNKVSDLCEYAYKYVSGFKSQSPTDDKNYFFSSGKTITDMKYQLIDIEVNAIGQQLLSNYNVNYIGSTGQGIAIGVDSMLPKQVDITQPIIGIYNPGNGVYGHWVTFVIAKVNDDDDKYTVYLKDSFGGDMNQYSSLKQAIEKKYGAKKIDFFHHTGNEQGDSKDNTSCGVYALANAEIVATWLTDKQDKEFENIQFTTGEQIINLRDQYNEKNIEFQKHQEDESQTSQSLSNNLTKVIVQQDFYKNIVDQLTTLFTNITIQKEEWINDTGNFKTFSTSDINIKNTIFVGISFGEHRHLINQHKYNISIQASHDLLNAKEKIEESLKTIQLEEVRIENEIFAKAFGSLDDKLYGVVDIANTSKGLTPDSIHLNLESIIQSNNQSNLYINPKIVGEKHLMYALLNWSATHTISSQYAAIIKVENESGKKHAVLLHARQVNDSTHITLIDPLSEEDSEFSMQLNTLKTTLSNQTLYQVQIIYAGCQDKDHGTCGDMSLIMLQELIKKTTNETIVSIDNQIILDNLIDSKQIQHDNNQFYNQNYDNHQLEVAGEVTFFH